MFLIVGGNSEVGAATARRLRAEGRRVAATTRRGADADQLFFDLEHLSDWRPPSETTAACICVAIARLAACEADFAGSHRVNVTLTLSLAEKLLAQGIYTLFLSTNQVFDGTRPRVHADAPASPISAYGRQKAATEAVFKTWIAQGLPAGILRLAKVVSPDMALIHSWRLKLLNGERIRAFRDMTMAPTPVSLVAKAIGSIMEQREPVIAQLTGPTDVTYTAVAQFLADKIGADYRLVESVSVLDNGLPNGSVPSHTTLDSSYLEDRWGIIAPDPWTVLSNIVSS